MCVCVCVCGVYVCVMFVSLLCLCLCCVCAFTNNMKKFLVVFQTKYNYLPQRCLYNMIIQIKFYKTFIIVPDTA